MGRRRRDGGRGPGSYPTLLAAAGLPPQPDQHVDGVDFGPVLRGERHDRGPIFWHYPHYSNQGGRPPAAVRDGRWKLIRHFEGDPDRLYDIVADPGEHTNLAAGHPDVAARLADALRHWLKDVSARVPEVNRQPHRFTDPPGHHA